MNHRRRGSWNDSKPGRKSRTERFAVALREQNGGGEHNGHCSKDKDALHYDHLLLSLVSSNWASSTFTDTFPSGFFGSFSSVHSESALPGASAWSKGLPVVGAWSFMSFPRNGTSRTSPSRL